ncbi:MAG: hemerythrin family protein [Epsilonproteobacteria bacterium]|nr:hemerythrin family protein [Campylobacterota bacterium]
MVKTSFEPMNEIHENELKILNDLIKALENRQNVEEKFSQFLNDVKKHFAFEEELMQKHKFFAYLPHKMEHDRILNELNLLNTKDYEEMENYFKNEFIPWFENHIATIDTVTAGFLNMMEKK